MRSTWPRFVILFVCGLPGALACSSSTGGGHNMPDAPSGSDAQSGEGVICGGFFPRMCADTEYCDYPSNTCGIADESGVCRTRPAACPAVVGPPTCGCDGKVHSGECPTYVTGSDLNATGSCPVDSMHFACGYVQCALATQYCRREPHADRGDTFSCAPLPACNGAPSCACLAGERCGNACTGNATAGLTLSCPSTP